MGVIYSSIVMAHQPRAGAASKKIKRLDSEEIRNTARKKSSIPVIQERVILKLAI